MSVPTSEDLIAALEEVSAEVERLTGQAQTSAAEIPARDSWSASEVVGHLCDAARYWGARMRRIVYEENPTLELFDENAMVRLAAHRFWPLDTLAREQRLLADATVAFLRGLTPADWERTGVHETRGLLTLREAVATEAEHEQGHVRQLAEALGVAPPA